MKNIMKSFNASSLWAGPGPRRRPRNPRRNTAPSAEILESRQLLSGGVTDPPTIPVSFGTPTNTKVITAQSGPMDNLGATMVSIYQSYSASLAAAAVAGSKAPAPAAAQLAAQFPTVEFNGGLVGMDVKSSGGNFNQFVSQLTNLGMQVTASSTEYGIVEGWVPPAELPTIAQLPQTMAGSPIYVPILSATGGFQGYQGVAYNEAETSLSADAARSQFGLTGAGVTIGALSDSVNEVGGGLQASYNTGDLSASNPVKVIQDDPDSGPTDEGRAMLENIHDIAPGANLQFATAFTGELGFQQNIEALYNAGSKVIVDDVHYLDEPFFQDGLVAQGVDYVTARGDTYFASAGNEGPDSGYLSAFRPVGATLGGISGTWQNFNGAGGSPQLALPILAVPGANIVFQYDQPYEMQEPAGSTAHVTSNVAFLVFNTSGQIVAEGNQNNVDAKEPFQMVTIPSSGYTGEYFVAIDLLSGTAPGHVEFEGQNDSNDDVAVDPVFGSAGGTYYPSTVGHQAAAATIGVAATPWWAPSPFLGQNPLANEPFSSTGPEYNDLSPKGTPVTPQVIQNPAITAPDGGNTSFFGFGPINTANPPIFGEPATSANLVPQNQQNLPGFFGTSSAAPNAAAVAALMLQANPSLTRVQIRTALETTALPMNGTPGGTLNVQSGYGLVNAVAAIKAVAPPTLAPTTITVTPSTNSPVVNNPFIVTVTVAGSSGTPTGSVDFYDIVTNTNLGSATLTGGVASMVITPSMPGSHVYLETYSGNGTYAKNTAYLVIVAGSGAPAVRIRQDYSPANEAFGTLIDSQVLNDVAVSVAALGASNAGVKKHAT
jgi:large repetitive protein